MKQEMTEVSEELKVTNAPSQITQRECFQRGHKAGYDLAIEYLEYTISDNAGGSHDALAVGFLINELQYMKSNQEFIATKFWEQKE